MSYHEKGDYLLPDLMLEDKKQYNIEKYGLLRLNYIKKFKPELYFDLLVNDKLNEYFYNINAIVMELGLGNRINYAINVFNYRGDMNKFITNENEY